MRKATIDPARWLCDWQIAQREARRLLRRLRRRLVAGARGSPGLPG